MTLSVGVEGVEGMAADAAWLKYLASPRMGRIEGAYNGLELDHNTLVKGNATKRALSAVERYA